MTVFFFPHSILRFFATFPNEAENTLGLMRSGKIFLSVCQGTDQAFRKDAPMSRPSSVVLEFKALRHGTRETAAAVPCDNMNIYAATGTNPQFRQKNRGELNWVWVRCGLVHVI